MKNESPDLKIWFLSVGVAFLLIGAAFSLGILADYSKITEVRKWPTIEGQITTQVVKASRHGQASELVRYQYLVNSKVYESLKINPNQYTEGKKDYFRVKKGEKIIVFVHYNERNPYESYLIVDWNPYQSTHFYYAIASLFMGIVFSTASLFMKRRKLEQSLVDSKEESLLKS